MTREDGVIDASILRPAAPEPVDAVLVDVQRGGTTGNGRA
jgi:hypothetical protein